MEPWRHKEQSTQKWPHLARRKVALIEAVEGTGRETWTLVTVKIRNHSFAHMLKLYLAAIVVFLVSSASAGKEHMPSRQDIEDAWQKLVNPLSPATCEETCLKTCCRDGGGQDCVDACGCKGRSCPQKLVNPLSSANGTCGAKCQSDADCSGFCTDCFGGLCRNDPLKNGTATANVYLIRHGEKDHKCAGGCKGCLSHKGKERAENLIKIFNGGRFSTLITLALVLTLTLHSVVLTLVRPTVTVAGSTLRRAYSRTTTG